MLSIQYRDEVRGEMQAEMLKARADTERPQKRCGFCSNEWDIAGSISDTCGKVRTITPVQHRDSLRGMMQAEKFKAGQLQTGFMIEPQAPAMTFR